MQDDESTMKRQDIAYKLDTWLLDLYGHTRATDVTAIIMICSSLSTTIVTSVCSRRTSAHNDTVCSGMKNVWRWRMTHGSSNVTSTSANSPPISSWYDVISVPPQTINRDSHDARRRQDDALMTSRCLAAWLQVIPSTWSTLRFAVALRQMFRLSFCLFRELSISILTGLKIWHWESQK